MNDLYVKQQPAKRRYLRSYGPAPDLLRECRSQQANLYAALFQQAAAEEDSINFNKVYLAQRIERYTLAEIEVRAGKGDAVALLDLGARLAIGIECTQAVGKAMHTWETLADNVKSAPRHRTLAFALLCFVASHNVSPRGPVFFIKAAFAYCARALSISDGNYPIFTNIALEWGHRHHELPQFGVVLAKYGRLLSMADTIVHPLLSRRQVDIFEKAHTYAQAERALLADMHSRQIISDEQAAAARKAAKVLRKHSKKANSKKGGQSLPTPVGESSTQATEPLTEASEDGKENEGVKQQTAVLARPRGISVIKLSALDSVDKTAISLVIGKDDPNGAVVESPELTLTPALSPFSIASAVSSTLSTPVLTFSPCEVASSVTDVDWPPQLEVEAGLDNALGISLGEDHHHHEEASDLAIGSHCFGEDPATRQELSFDDFPIGNFSIWKRSQEQLSPTPAHFISKFFHAEMHVAPDRYYSTAVAKAAQFQAEHNSHQRATTSPEVLQERLFPLLNKAATPPL